MEILPNLMRNKNCFIAVGWGHLGFKQGILNQLKDNGFKVDPIEMKPVAKKISKQ